MNFDFIYRGETKDIDDDIRASTGGSFIRLSNGFTHYELGGPSLTPFHFPMGEGLKVREPVVLIHGFSVPYFVFDPTFNFLVSAGFHVLRYDLFGRGFSDRPHVKYTMDLFVNQLKELLDASNIKQANLIGLSMGGAIASAFTVNVPERVRRLVLIDPVGIQSMPFSWMYQAAVLPGVSELILGVVGIDRMVQGVASDFFNSEHIKMFQNQYRVQMQFRGFTRAILSNSS